MIEEISKFYKDTFAPMTVTIVDNKGVQTKQHYAPLPRINFLSGAVFAQAFLVYSIAASALYLVANLFTCFLCQSFREGLFQNAEMIPVYTGAIPLGFIGALFPGTINEKVLHIPESGLSMPFQLP